MFNNKAEFNGLDLVAIFKDCNLININEDFHSEGVAIDSRQIKMGNIFVALKGDNTDGHNYIKSAIDSGASTCIIERQYSTDIINMFPDEDLLSVMTISRLYACLQLTIEIVFTIRLSP